MPISSNIDMKSAQYSIDHNEVMASKRKLEQMRKNFNSGTEKSKEEKLREACEGFETIFIQKMWQQMQNTVQKEGYLHSKEEKFWQDMYDQELSKKMSASGGVGLADMMVEQLNKSLEHVSRTTANNGSFNREPMSIEPAPLIPIPLAKAGIDIKPQEEKAKPDEAIPDIYSGSAETVAVVEEPVDEKPLDEFSALVQRLQQESVANATPERVVISRTIIQPNASKDESIPRVPADHPITGRTPYQQSNLSINDINNG